MMCEHTVIDHGVTMRCSQKAVHRHEVQEANLNGRPVVMTYYWCEAHAAVHGDVAAALGMTVRTTPQEA